jgi:hypothetical protein
MSTLSRGFDANSEVKYNREQEFQDEFWDKIRLESIKTDQQETVPRPKPSLKRSFTEL